MPSAPLKYEIIDYTCPRCGYEMRTEDWVHYGCCDSCLHGDAVDRQIDALKEDARKGGKNHD